MHEVLHYATKTIAKHSLTVSLIVIGSVVAAAAVKEFVGVTLVQWSAQGYAKKEAERRRIRELRGLQENPDAEA